MPLRAIVTQGTAADCKQAMALIDGFSAQYLPADRGYDTNEILDQAQQQGMSVVIPPEKNRKEQRDYDKDVYKARHIVENAFSHVGSMTAWGATINSGSPGTFIDTLTKGLSSGHTLDNKEKYDEKVRVLDKDRNPIVNMPYFVVRDDGKSYKGFTDKEGCCPRIYTPTQQNITIFLGVEALEKWGV